MKFLLILFVVLCVALGCVAIYDKITKSKHDELIEILIVPMMFIGFWIVYCVLVP